MLARTGSYLIPSLLVHGAFFAALASSPPPLERVAMTRPVEFTVITDLGGGRIGDDEQIGDAAEPTEPPERIFRKVEPKPKPKRHAPVAKASEEAKPTPSPARDDGDSSSEVTSGAGSGEASAHSMIHGSAGRDPNATSSGTGSGQEGIDRRSALRAWLREIQREVNKIATRNYPSAAIRMRLEGRLRLGITIGNDGEIISVRVLSSSGHAVLDDSATASVMSLHIPAPPEALGWREREISLPIRYALQ